MRYHNPHFVRFGAVTIITAALTAPLWNIGSASAALPDLLAGRVTQPDYELRSAADSKRRHDQVLDEVTPGEPVDFHQKFENRDSHRAGKDWSSVPTSMLWPAYKYVPQLSKSLRG